jgi:hypothetical protein
MVQIDALNSLGTSWYIFVEKLVQNNVDFISSESQLEYME